MQSRRQREDTGIAQGAKFTALAGLDRIVKLADSRCQSGRTLAQRFPQANPARYLIAGLHQVGALAQKRTRCVALREN